MKRITLEQSTPWIALDTIAPLLPTNPVIVEAGGHNGKGTLRLKKQWPDSIIHVFEPVPHLYQELVQRTQGIPGVFCYNLALSNVCGTATMHISSGKTDACSSLLEPHSNLTDGRPDIVFGTTVTVTTITLDAWQQEHKIPTVDFLWLDLQGAELHTLQGAQHLLKTAQVLHVEINEVERYVGGVLYPELKSFLEAHHFYPYIKALNQHGWGNGLFLRD